MAPSFHGLLSTYRGGWRGEEEGEEKKGRDGGFLPRILWLQGSRPLSDREEKIIPLLFLKIDFKYSLLLITVQPQNGLNEQKGVVGYSERSIATVIWSLRTEKSNNLSPTASAHAIVITGTLTRTLDRQTKREKLCSVGVG